MSTDDRSKRGVGEGSQIPGTQVLTDVSEALGRIFSVRLDVPSSVSDQPEKKGKEFCVGLLEKPVTHAWWPTVGRLGALERASVSGSLFLTRKALPSSPDPHQAAKHARLMASRAPSAPPAYLSFVVRELREMFKPGWDRGYASHVFRHTPTSSACLQYSRANGGARRWLSEQGQDWFSDVCLGESPLREASRVRYTVVNTGGKQRGVTVADGLHHVLGPLHRTLYDYLSQFGWLLRGEARGKKFRSFNALEGEVFVSGDYESATDNLSLEVTELILSEVLSHARHVPASVRDFALRSLRSKIEYRDLGGLVVDQQRGQLMGNFLSFPLLCLHNYLAFKYSIPRNVPLKINGDDIVFRCRPSEEERWRRNVGASGLTLSAGKTLVHSRFFSLNSAFFLARRVRGVLEVPVIRAGMLRCEGFPSGAAFSRFIRGWRNDGRRIVGAMWLRSHRAAFQFVGRSVRECGIPADNSQLHTAGLAPRESFFRGYRVHLRLPEQKLPVIRVGHTGQPCENWVYHRGSFRSVGRQRQQWDRQYFDECSRFVWQAKCERPEVYWDSWWSEAASTGFESAWLSWRRTVKKVRKMRCRLNLILRPPLVWPRLRGQWVPRDELPALLYSFPGVGFR